MKRVRYFLEAIPIWFLIVFTRLIGIDLSSSLGGFIAKRLGPLLKATRYARHNIKLALPHLTPPEIKEIIQEMWDNIGRTFFEMPHIYRLSDQEFKKRVKIIGLEKVKKFKQAIFITGHFGNWEVAAKGLKAHDLLDAIVYRKLNNPILNDLMKSLRSCGLEQIPKGVLASKRIIKYLIDKKSIGILGDQKLDEGLWIDFFKKPAKTLSAPAKLSIKYNIPMFFCRVIRIKGAYFQMHVQGPVPSTAVKQNKGSDMEVELTIKMNRIYEEWIKDLPAQWFWVHRRWEKDFYR